MTLPIELIIHIFSFLDIKINNIVDLKYIDNCSICYKYFTNPYKKWYCSSSCLEQLLLMI
jgi:hypothetical protein